MGLSHNPSQSRDGGRDPGLLLAREHLSPLVGEYPRRLAGGRGVKSWVSPVPASQKLAAGQAGWVESQDKVRVQTPIRGGDRWECLFWTEPWLCLCQNPCL